MNHKNFFEKVNDFILSFINLPKEIEKIMARFDEVLTAFADLKATIAEEADELNAKFDALEARIEELLGNQMPDLEPFLSDIRATIDKVEALSEPTTEEEPTEEEPVEEVPTEPTEEPVL